MRGPLTRALRAALLIVFCGTAVAQTEPGPSSLQGNPIDSAPVAGWDGSLPIAPLPPLDYKTPMGDINIFIEQSARLDDRRGRSRWAAPCDRYPLGQARQHDGAARTAGYFHGGTFGSALRCDDDYPGLPLRTRRWDEPGR